MGVPFSLFEKAEKAVRTAYGSEDEEGVEVQDLAGLVTRPDRDTPILPESVTAAAHSPGPRRNRRSA